MSKENERVVWIDIAKAISIFLIVLGHTLREGIVHQTVYSFHVVAFFLLSGMTCRTDNVAKRIKNDFLRIMIPYYIFGFASIAIFMFLGKFAATQLEMYVDTSVGYNIWGLLYANPALNPMKFNMPLWFLPSLFIVKICYYTLSKVCRQKPSILFSCCCGLSILAVVYSSFDFPALPFNLSVSFKMLPFFSIGRIIFSNISLRKSKGGGYSESLMHFSSEHRCSFWLL